MQSRDYEAYAVSSLPATTNAYFGSFHRQRASHTPPPPVRSSRQNARSSRPPQASVWTCVAAFCYGFHP
jgi:hypothetical protein